MLAPKGRLPLAVLAVLGLATIVGCSSDADPLMAEMDAGEPEAVVSEPVALIAGVDRIFASNRTVGLADDGATIIVEDVTQTPSGWSLTVDGKTVALDANDYGADSFVPDSYYKRLGDDEEVGFWSLEGGGFDGDPEFEYLNIYGFYHSDLVPNADLSTFETTDFERGSIVHIVHGTPSSDMPLSGTATYDGRVRAQEWPSDAAVFSSGSTVYTGDFDMTASFGPGGASVVGQFDFHDVTGGTIPFAVDVAGNRLSVDGLSITEGHFAGYQNISVRGAFFGPSAAEVGGVFEGDNPAAATLMHGFFAGRQSQDNE